MLKKGLHKTVSTLNLNEIYEKAISAGALGGKLLGVGDSTNLNLDPYSSLRFR